MCGQLLVVQIGFLKAGSSLQGGADGLQGGVHHKGNRTVRPINSEEKGNFGKEGKGNEGISGGGLSALFAATQKEARRERGMRGMEEGMQRKRRMKETRLQEWGMTAVREMRNLKMVRKYL